MSSPAVVGKGDGLRQLFNPASVAIIGATDNPKKWGYQYSSRLLAAENRRRVYLINQKRGTVLGRKAFRSLEDLPEAPEVVVVCVPRDGVLQAVESAAGVGAKYVICIAAGFAETGDEGRTLQEKVLSVARRGGVRIVGPNCLGVIDATAQFHCSAFWDIPVGRTGLVSQSGMVMVELGLKLSAHGLGVSRGVSVGNQADLALDEYLDAFKDDPNTQVVVAYIEGFGDGRAVFAAAERVIAAGKPFIVLAPFGSDAVRRAAVSHTGSLVSSDAIIDATCEDVGVIRVTSISDLLLALKGVYAPTRSKGTRVATLSDGGGAAILGAGVATLEGFTMPPFSDSLRQRLSSMCSFGSGVLNPIDYVGALDLEVFVPVVGAVADSHEVDAVILNGFFNNVHSAVDPAKEKIFADRIVETILRGGQALAVATPLPNEPAIKTIAAAGIPTFENVTDAARCLMLARHRIARRPLPPLPQPAVRLAQTPDYFAARQLLANGGVKFMSARRISTREEAQTAASDIGFPVALKGLTNSHKSEFHAVALNLGTAADLDQAFTDMAKRLAPPFSVEAMVDGRTGVELLIGGLLDRSFGPTLAVGIGGIFTEILNDSVVALAPVDPVYAKGMLLSLRGAALLQGYRGRPSVDLDAIANAVAAFSRFLAEHPEIAEAELNPVFALPDAAIAVDGRIALV